MRSYERIITHVPLGELWNDNGPVPAERLRELSSDQIRELLRAGPIRLVLADVGSGPGWISEARCFAVWKEEVCPHLADPGKLARLDDFPGGYCYFASEWSLVGSRSLIVLERSH